MSNTVSGPGWHRYNGDGYGDGASDGHPWAPSGKGTGHVWPVLTGERAEYDLTSGNPATALQLLSTMRNFASGVGLIPEQDWELTNLPPSPYGTDPTVASIGFQNGHPAGSAAPLSWADGQYVRLVRDITTGRIVDRPADTYNRYVTHQQATTTLTVTAPADQSAVSEPGRDRHRHDGAGEHGLRRRHEHRSEQRHDHGQYGGEPPTARSASPCRSPAGPPCSTSWPSARPGRRRTPSAASSSTSRRERSCSTRPTPPETTTGRATTPIRPRPTSIPARTIFRTSGSRRRRPTSSSSCRCATCRRRSAARWARNSSTSMSTTRPPPQAICRRQPRSRRATT